jgi:hypothetical protein
LASRTPSKPSRGPCSRWRPIPTTKTARKGTDKILAATKANLMRRGRGIALRVRVVEATVYDAAGDPIVTSRLDVLGPSSIAADDLLADATERGARRDVLTFLRQALAAGPMNSNALKAAAKSAGVSWRSVERYYREVCKPAKPAKSRGPWLYELLPVHLAVHTPGGHGELGDNSAISARGPNGEVADRPLHDQVGGHGEQRAFDLDAYRRHRDAILGERDEDE